MDFLQFQQRVENILDAGLPAASPVVSEGQSIANDIEIGRTAFMDKMGVDSEEAYKRQCIRDGEIMFHAHIGLGSWEATAHALTYIYNIAERSDFVIDRAGLCLDRRMGLPAEYRHNVPAETGPTLESSRDWMQVGSTVPIQPHMGDFMIGFPASTGNTVKALKAGVTTIGNLSQFFSHEVPMWSDQITTTVETVQAMALMGRLRNKGVLVHSYLEDGLGALFYDCATVAGWAYLERYIVEQLLGGKLAHCIGGLTTDPVKRAGWVFALHEVHEHDCVGSMIYGDTISFTDDFAVNRGIVGEYLLWDIMAQLACPTGHAVHPLPVTEAVRIPSAEEIAEAQTYGRQIEQAARRLVPHIDFSAAYEFADTMVSVGKTVFTNALDGMEEAGVDINDPVQTLYVLKKLGPAIFEEMFGAGGVDDTYIRGRKPVVPTDIYKMSLAAIDQYRPTFLQPKMKDLLGNRRMLIASTDVHEHGVFVISQLLSEAGVNITNLGAEINPDEIVSAARNNDVDAILISTHNGMALDYANHLKDELERHNLSVPVLIGGILNQKIEDEALPVDVTNNLRQLGFHPHQRLGQGFLKMFEPIDENNLETKT